MSDDEHEIKIDRFLDNTYIKQLTDQQKQLCEGNITSEEIKSVIKNMKTDKTPGIDGIPVEFYRFCWVDIGNLLVRSLRAAFITKELSISQKRRVITCIPKEDKPREFMKNWRPISLLCTD